MDFSFKWSRGTATNAALLLLALLIAFALPKPAAALQGALGIHDPSSIVKVGDTYHIWGTGNGIYHLESKDLVNWTMAAPVFKDGSPAWIQSYVSGFGGFFWAPYVTRMGGRYYLYFSCSLGARPCAIGCATSSDALHWTDRGMVIYSDNTTVYGSIDPGVFEDASGKYWMTWGSHLTGIWVARLDPATGRLLNSTKTNIANFDDAEASQVIYNDGYYYLFYNRGICCNGVKSTYYISVARAAKPDGPYTGSRPFATGESPYFGPGQLGYLLDRGVQYITYHYYNGNNSGMPTLEISHLTWQDGWPVNNPDWIAGAADPGEVGTYKITNAASGLAWTGGTGASLQPVAQAPYTGAANQCWIFHSLGYGLYDITCSTGGLGAEIFNCNPNDGGLLDLFNYWGGNSQQWKVERYANGSYVLESYNSNRCVDAPSGAKGMQLDIWDFNGLAGQQWNISPP